ncbi:MAG: response regulator transcription factor [Fimbriimonadaceae bacterium]|nr:response regulator transcription factor [Chitinophagales bacterium]
MLYGDEVSGVRCECKMLLTFRITFNLNFRLTADYYFLSTHYTYPPSLLALNFVTMRITKFIFIYALLITGILITWFILEKLFFTGTLSYQWFITIAGSLILIAGIYFGRNIFTKTIIKKEKEIIEKEVIVEKEVFLSNDLKLAENNLLSVRESEILLLISKGFTNESIAKELFISLNTVKTHIANIFIKLDVKNRTSAIAEAKNMKILY